MIYRDKTKPDKPTTASSGLWSRAALAAIIIGAVIIRGRLLSIPLERDEGEYAYVAQQMLQGVFPYESAYSMKLPGIYAVYAIFLAVFGQTITAIHLGLIIFNAATIFVVFLLTRRLFGDLAGVMAAGVYAVTSLTEPVLGLSANAEHFVVLPALIGVLLIAKPGERRRLTVVFWSALLFGLAFVIKQHGIFFVLFAAGWLLYSDLRSRPFKIAKTVLTQLVFIVGAALPFVLICLFYRHLGTFDKFWFWTFTYAGKYAAPISPGEALTGFLHKFGPLFYSAFPVWVFVLAGSFYLLFNRRMRPNVPLVLGFFIFSFLSICPGFYFREHYFILLLPAVAMLAGVGFAGLANFLSGFIPLPTERGIIVSLIGLAVTVFSLFHQRLFLFYLTPVDVCHRVYSGNPFPESLEIARYIKENSAPDDTIAVIGSEPQIYFYSSRRSATRYIYAYPLMERHGYAGEMQKEMIDEIESARPEFVVFVNIRASWLNKPDSTETIFGWFNSYIHENYELVGITDMLSNGLTIYRWGQQAEEYTPRSGAWLAVYKRKP